MTIATNTTEKDMNKHINIDSNIDLGDQEPLW